MAKNKIDSTLLDRAITFAVKAHANTERNGKGYPYIVHPMEAVVIVATMTSDQELLAAAALHDTVEDTDARFEQPENIPSDILSILLGNTTEVNPEQPENALSPIFATEFGIFTEDNLVHL